MRRESGLLHPVALAAIALLLVNDHVLKACCANALTDKLSDFAGLVFFPLLVRAIAWPLAWRIVRRDPLIAAIVATAVGFTAVKLWQPANTACELALGVLQWPIRAIASGELVALEPVSIVRDPTDLVALVALAVPLWIGRNPRISNKLTR